MLGYKGYLDQSRARRGYTEFPVHYEHPEIKSNQNIKDFVSTPNYGQIFYSQNGQHQELNTQLKSSLQSQKSRQGELVKYVYQLEQENAMLKNRLAQVMNIQQNNSNCNVDSYLRIQGGNQGYYNHQMEPEYITSSIPTQNYIKDEPGYHQQHVPQFSFTGNVPRNAGLRNDGQGVAAPQRSSVPLNSNPNLDKSLYQPPQRFSQSPVIPEQIQTQYLSQQQIHSQPHLQPQPYPQSYPQSYPQPYPQQPQPSYQFGLPSQSIPYRESYEQPLRQSQSQQNLIWAARQKLNQIKDDDEELRAYTLRLLRRS